MDTMTTPTTLTIQQMAERSGLTAHTLRYYERVGLHVAGSARPAEPA